MKIILIGAFPMAAFTITVVNYIPEEGMPPDEIQDILRCRAEYREQCWYSELVPFVDSVAQNFDVDRIVIVGPPQFAMKIAGNIGEVINLPIDVHGTKKKPNYAKTAEEIAEEHKKHAPHSLIL